MANKRRIWYPVQVPPANNRAAYKIAMENGWYSRFDAGLNDIVSCDWDHPDAHVDIVRAFDRMKLGHDRGPITAETIVDRNFPEGERE